MILNNSNFLTSFTYSPDTLVPQCATKSTSKNPGRVVHKPRSVYLPLNFESTLYMVAADIDLNNSSSFLLNADMLFLYIGSQIGIADFNLSEHIRFVFFHKVFIKLSTPSV